MTIVTQENISLNYRFIKSVGLYDAELDNGKSCLVVSAVGNDDQEIDIAAYTSSIEAESAYASFQNALRNNASIFVFPDDSGLADSDDNSQNTVEISSYRNRFVNKDES